MNYLRSFFLLSLIGSFIVSFDIKAQVVTPYGTIFLHLQDSSWRYDYSSLTDSTLDSFTVRTYNSNNKLVSRYIYSIINSDSLLTNENEYEYNQDNYLAQRTEESSYNQSINHFTSRTIFKYTQQEQIVDYQQLNWNNNQWELVVEAHSEYENQNQILDNSTYYENGEEVFRFTSRNYYYDDSTYRYSGSYSYQTMQLDSTFIKENLDEFKNTIQKTSYIWDNNWNPNFLQQFTISYSATNQIIEKLTKSAVYNIMPEGWGELTNSSKITNSYDSDDNLIESKNYEWKDDNWELIGIDIDEKFEEVKKTISRGVKYNSGVLSSGYMWVNILSEDSTTSITERYSLSAPDSVWQGWFKFEYSLASALPIITKYYEWSLGSWEDIPSYGYFDDYNVYLSDSSLIVGCEFTNSYTDTLQVSTDTIAYYYKDPVLFSEGIQLEKDTLILQEIPETFYHWINCNSGDTIQSSNVAYFVPSEPGYYSCLIGDPGCYIETDCFPFKILGLNDVLHVSIYPNPSKNLIYVKTPQSNPYTFNLFDLNGNVVRTKSDQCENVEIDISGLPNGVYLLRIENKNYIKSYRVIKK